MLPEALLVQLHLSTLAEEPGNLLDQELPERRSDPQRQEGATRVPAVLPLVPTSPMWLHFDSG